MKEITILKDKLGNDYLGIKFKETEIKPYISLWKNFTDFELYSNNRFNRDGEYYHLTLFNVVEYNWILNNFDQNDISNIFKHKIKDIQFLGIGKATKNENETNFIVLNSETLNYIRREFKQDSKDLHITLGFKIKDIFGVSKGIDTIYKKYEKIS